MNDLHLAFRNGAEQLAGANYKFTELHRSHGIQQTDWELLTQVEHWTPEQARQVRGVLGQVLEVALTIAGMPAIPLPGQYVAAVIAMCVSPANKLVASTKVPDTFDAVSAAGVTEPFEVKPMRTEQMMGLVMMYSGGIEGEPAMHRLPATVLEVVKEEASK